MPMPKVQLPRAVESDLRPVSLTATLAKVLESFVGSWILERVGDSLNDWQFGARRQRSTTHAWSTCCTIATSPSTTASRYARSSLTLLKLLTVLTITY